MKLLSFSEPIYSQTHPPFSMQNYYRHPIPFPAVTRKMSPLCVLSLLLMLCAASGCHASPWDDEPLTPPEAAEEPAPPPLPSQSPPSPATQTPPSPAAQPPPSPAAQSPPSPASQNSSLEYMDPTLPPLLPVQNPKCSVVVLRHDFGHTVGEPPVSAPYSPPADCPAPWSRVVLELSAAASGSQRDRIAAVWLDGAELLRTTTPFPMSPGVHWRVRKDVTRFTALLRRNPGPGDRAFAMMLENSKATFPGVYAVNLSLHFYRGALCCHSVAKPMLDVREAKLKPALGAHPTINGLYREPADLIIPISNGAEDSSGGYWFKVRNESEVPGVAVLVPNNTYRAVLEVYVSHHGDDEYWYANPLRSTNDGALRSGRRRPRPPPGEALESARPNGAFRQVVASIDGRYVGSAVPFPVIYPGSVNPFFWAPVSAIGAYDHPSYDLDITPFVGQLIDGKGHKFGLAVRDSQPFWLVSANLHLWLDAWSDAVEGALVRYKVPPLRLSRQADWEEHEGKSEIEGQAIIRFSGWVSSSKGNITTSVRHKIKFKSHVEVEDKGEVRNVEMENKARTNIRIETDDVVIGRVLVETEAPLQMSTESSNGGGGSRFHKTKLYHGLQETRSVAESKGASFSTIADRQESEGSVLMRDGVALWGSGDTKSTYKFRDDKACYLRTVSMVGGKVEEDEETASCAAVAAS